MTDVILMYEDARVAADHCMGKSSLLLCCVCVRRRPGFGGEGLRTMWCTDLRISKNISSMSKGGGL